MYFDHSRVLNFRRSLGEQVPLDIESDFSKTFCQEQFSPTFFMNFPFLLTFTLLQEKTLQPHHFPPMLLLFIEFRNKVIPPLYVPAFKG